MMMSTIVNNHGRRYIDPYRKRGHLTDDEYGIDAPELREINNNIMLEGSNWLTPSR